MSTSYPPYRKSLIYPRGITDDQFPVAQVTPHSQAWGIPSTLEIDDLPLRMTDQQLQASVIMMWRQYILHDELLLAISFLEKAPFNVRDTKITQDALKITKKMIEWMDIPILAQQNNATQNVDVEVDVPLPFPLKHNQSGGRFNLIVKHLPKNKISIVDLGCCDGMFTNRFGLMGHEVYGLDLVETSVALANKKAEEFKTGAKHIVCYFHDAEDKIPLNYFDYATCTDTYEHLIDPVVDLLLPAKKMIKSDGKFLMTTPYGAWMRGNYVSWAHPWLWANDNLSWLSGSHYHLIAPSVWSVAKHLREAGFYVKNSYAVLCDPADVKNQGNVFAEAHKQPPTNFPGKNVVFVITGSEEWNPKTLIPGDVEKKVLEMSTHLASLGDMVRVFNNCGVHGEGIYDGVEYHHLEKSQDIQCDILFDRTRL